MWSLSVLLDRNTCSNSVHGPQPMWDQATVGLRIANSATGATVIVAL